MKRHFAIRYLPRVPIPKSALAATSDANFAALAAGSSSKCQKPSTAGSIGGSGRR
jgi:hypothetical protein